jgi:hypothetical protein
VDGPHHFSVNPPFYPLGPTLARNRMLTADGYRARVAWGGAERSVHVENGACAEGCDCSRLMRCIAQKWTILRGLSARMPSRLQKQQRCEAAVSAHVGCQGSVRVDSLVQE